MDTMVGQRTLRRIDIVGTAVDSENAHAAIITVTAKFKIIGVWTIMLAETSPRTVIPCDLVLAVYSYAKVV